MGKQSKKQRERVAIASETINARHEPRRLTSGRRKATGHLSASTAAIIFGIAGLTLLGAAAAAAASTSNGNAANSTPPKIGDKGTTPKPKAKSTFFKQQPQCKAPKAKQKNKAPTPPNAPKPAPKTAPAKIVAPPPKKVTPPKKTAQSIEDIKKVLAKPPNLRICNKAAKSLVHRSPDNSIQTLINGTPTPKASCNKRLKKHRKKRGAKAKENMDKFLASLSTIGINCGKKIIKATISYMDNYVSIQASKSVYTKIGNCNEVTHLVIEKLMSHNKNRPNIKPLKIAQLELRRSDGEDDSHTVAIVFPEEEKSASPQTKYRKGGIKTINELFPHAHIIDSYNGKGLIFPVADLTHPTNFDKHAEAAIQAVYDGRLNSQEVDKYKKGVAYYYNAFDEWSIDPIAERPTDPCIQPQLDAWEKEYAAPEQKATAAAPRLSRS